ncbi:hypothetical protein FRC00_007212 [Tulasnella sp. 408]|nr:hypothetical protein FRC00_007212 [Tulasnella sp. 408]
MVVGKKRAHRKKAPKKQPQKKKAHYVLPAGGSSATAAATGPSSTNLEANVPATHSYEWATNQPILPPLEPMEISETFIEPDPYGIKFS